jgi:hypothetical protein
MLASIRPAPLNGNGPPSILNESEQYLAGPDTGWVLVSGIAGISSCK